MKKREGDGPFFPEVLRSEEKEQCDQMAKLFFYIWTFSAIKIGPIA